MFNSKLEVLSVSGMQRFVAGSALSVQLSVFFFLMGDGLLEFQRMRTSPLHSPKVSAQVR